MNKYLIALVVLIFGSYTYGQQSNCRVLLPSISGSYSGDCKKGLANGKGTANGIDSYEGHFFKGLPEGKGTYKWANGSYYTGSWKAGMREGQGKYVAGDSVVSGFWKADKFLGEKPKPAYKVTLNRNIARYSVVKTVESGNGVQIKVLLGGTENTEIEDFSLAFSSGSEFRNYGTYGIENTSVPLDVTVRYRSWNQLHSTQYDVVFEFVIYDPGTWKVTLTNM